MLPSCLAADISSWVSNSITRELGSHTVSRLPIVVSGLAKKKKGGSDQISTGHIAWHTSEGFCLEFVETEDQILSASLSPSDKALVTDTCAAWDEYSQVAIFVETDSGI